MIEENNLVLRCESLERVRYLHIDLEFNDLAQLTDCDIVRDMKPEEELSKQFLFVNHLRVYRLNDNGEHRRMLESKVLELNLPLGYYITQNSKEIKAK